LEQDFADLIDIADVGRRAVGANPDQDGTAGAGLQADSTGKLAMKVADPFKVDAQSGLTLGLGWSLELNEETPAVLEVKQGLGLVRTSAEGLSIKLAPNSGLALASDGLSVDSGAGFQKGMIMMFSGATIPNGWALCDGTNGTPNLVDRFVLGGNLADSGTSSSSSFNGSGSSKSYSAKADAVTPAITVTIGDTTLSEQQLPGHRHGLGQYAMASSSSAAPTWAPAHLAPIAGDGATWAFTNWDQTRPASGGMWVSVLSSMTGASSPHSHSGSATQASHDHTVTITPPYYILAFIMKS